MFGNVLFGVLIGILGFQVGTNVGEEPPISPYMYPHRLQCQPMECFKPCLKHVSIISSDLFSAAVPNTKYDTQTRGFPSSVDDKLYIQGLYKALLILS